MISLAGTASVVSQVRCSHRTRPTGEGAHRRAPDGSAARCSFESMVSAQAVRAPRE